MESWGRDAARRRYADGGNVEVNTDDQPTDSPLQEQPANRADEVDEFISKVMRDQIKKMDS